MHSPFGLQKSERVATADHELDRADAGLRTFRDGLDLKLEAPMVGPPGVHAQENLGPVLSVSPTCSGLYVTDGVTRVVLTAE